MLARIAFVQEVAHRISSVLTHLQVQTLTITDTACRAKHLPMFPATSRLGSRRTTTLISAIQLQCLAIVWTESQRWLEVRSVQETDETLKSEDLALKSALDQSLADQLYVSLFDRKMELTAVLAAGVTDLAPEDNEFQQFVRDIYSQPVDAGGGSAQQAAAEATTGFQPAQFAAASTGELHSFA